VVDLRALRANSYPQEGVAEWLPSIDRFQFMGDAPWTFHRLHPGDTVDISITYGYLLPAANAPGLHTSAAMHDFWAHYRIGVR
jgi:hypothetical protein